MKHEVALLDSKTERIAVIGRAQDPLARMTYAALDRLRPSHVVTTMEHGAPFSARVWAAVNNVPVFAYKAPEFNPTELYAQLVRARRPTMVLTFIPADPKWKPPSTLSISKMLSELGDRGTYLLVSGEPNALVYHEVRDAITAKEVMEVEKNRELSL